MPTRPPSLRPRQTERDRKRAIDRHRGSPAERGYDAEWRRFREEVIIERGFRCEMCGKLGAMSKATASAILELLNVHHKLSIEERPDLRLDRNNVEVAHQSCHSRHTAREQGFARPGPRE